MKGSVKIVGTNSITRHLQNQTFDNSSIETKGKIHDFYLNDKKYFLDIKESYFHPNFVLIFGMISDDAEFVGNIGLEFYPNK